MDLALIFQALFPFLAECQDEGKVKEDENTLHQKMTRQLDALFSKPHFPLDLQIMAHDLFQKLFIQQEVLPLDDLLFYVLQGKPSKRDSIFVKRKRPNVEGVDVRRDDPPLPSANDPDGHPMNWFATLALNIISQSNYLLKVTVTRCSSNHPPPEPTPHHPPLTTIWQGQAFASPNKSYFGDHQNISTEDSSSEKNAAEISFHDYEESLRNLLLHPGSTLTLELFFQHSSIPGSTVPIFQGAVSYEALNRVFVAKKRVSASRESLLSPHEFILMRGPAGKGTAQIAVHRSIPTAFRRQPENLEHLFEEMKMKAINRVRSWASDAAFASFIPAQAKLPEIIAPSTTLLYENPSPDAFAFAVTFIHLDWRSIFKDILLASPLAG